MIKIKKYFPGITRNIFFLSLTSFFADISSEMLYPVLPLFLTTTLGVKPNIVGIIQGIGEGTQYAFQGVSGWLSDKLQRPKLVALAGYTIGALSKPFIGLSNSWPQVLGARFFERLGSATRSAPRDGLIASSVEAKDRGRAFGLESVGDNLGAFIGPLIAFILITTTHISLRSIFFIALIPEIFALTMISQVKEVKLVVASKAAIKIESIKDLPKSFWKYLSVIAIFGFGNSSNAFLILKAKDLGFSFSGAIFLYAIFNLSAAIISYPAGTLSDTLSRKKILLIGFFIFFVVYLGFALTTSLLVTVLLFVVYGGFQGIFRSVGKATAAGFLPEHLRSTGMGIYLSVLGLSTLVASVIAGQLWVKVNPASVFFYGAIASGVAILFLLTFKLQSQTQES